MKFKLIFFNILLLGVFIPFIGGGDFSKLGYFFLLGSLLLAFPLFGKAAESAFFNKGTTFLYLFLTYFFITSGMDILGGVALFGRLCPPIFCSLILVIITKYPHLYKTQRFFLILWIAILCYFELQSLIFISQYPQGLRELVSIKKDASLIIGGGFSLPYSLAILVPGLFLFFRIGLTKVQKIIVLILCVYFAYLVFSALYMTAIILMIFGICLALFRGYSYTRQFFIISLIAAVGIMAYEFVPILITEFSPKDSNILISRFNEIDSILSGNDLSQSKDFFSRILLSLSSIETFLENPLLGIGWKTNYNFFALEEAGVGSHAQWFDIFACYGIFALLLVKYLQKSATPFVRNNNITFILFVILGFFNPCLQFTIVFVTFCLVPMCRILYLTHSSDAYTKLSKQIP